jgi:uncharacterized protein (DUF58 family)
MNQPLAHSLKRSISKVKLFAKYIVDGFSTGLHRSAKRGASVTFKQHRPYVTGDEVRHIDWRVFARSDRYYVREYEQETSLKATLLLDLSGSMKYAGAQAIESKAQYAKALALELAALLLRQQDAVGLITFDTSVRTSIPPSSRPTHLRLLEERLQQHHPGGETSLARTLNAASPRLGKRGLLILISDCFEDAPALANTLAQLRARHHEVLVFQIFDKDELEFPFHGWSCFESLENVSLNIVADADALRKQYLENLAKHRAELGTGLRKHGIQLFPITTDEPCASALTRHLSTRIARG